MQPVQVIKSTQVTPYPHQQQSTQHEKIKRQEEMKGNEQTLKFYNRLKGLERYTLSASAASKNIHA